MPEMQESICKPRPYMQGAETKMNDSELHEELALAIAHLTKLMSEFESRRIVRIQKKREEIRNGN